MVYFVQSVSTHDREKEGEIEAKYSKRRSRACQLLTEKSTVFQPFKPFFSDLHALSNYHKEIIALVSLAGNNCSGQPCLPAIVSSVLFAALGRVCVPVGKKIPLSMKILSLGFISSISQKW